MVGQHMAYSRLTWDWCGSKYYIHLGCLDLRPFTGVSCRWSHIFLDMFMLAGCLRHPIGILDINVAKCFSNYFRTKCTKFK